MAKAKKKTLKSRVRSAEKKAGRAAKRTGAKIERGAKKAARKTKTFAKTKTGYTAGGAGIGALALGPLGAIAGAIGGSALHDNPRSDLLVEYKLKIEGFSDGKLEESFKEYDELISGSKTPVRDFGTEGYPLVMQMLSILRAEMNRRGLLVMNPKRRGTRRRNGHDPSAQEMKDFGEQIADSFIREGGDFYSGSLTVKEAFRLYAGEHWGVHDSLAGPSDVNAAEVLKLGRKRLQSKGFGPRKKMSSAFPKANPKRKTTKKKPARRRKNPSAVDHERVGLDALKQSEKYHRRYMEYNRLNDLLDTYKWLLISHEELKYSGKAEPRIQARDGLKAVRRLLLERM